VTAVSARHSGPIPDVDASTVPAEQRRRHRSGFWAVVFAFLIVMAIATLPSLLYGLYRTRDHLSALTITVVYAIFAGSTIATLRRDSSIATRIGRRARTIGTSVTVGALGVGPLIAGYLAQGVTQPLRQARHKAASR
jgi:hypothetical protein